MIICSPQLGPLTGHSPPKQKTNGPKDYKKNRLLKRSRAKKLINSLPQSDDLIFIENKIWANMSSLV